MKNVCWGLIGLAVVTFVIGSVLVVTRMDSPLAGETFFKGTVCFLLFAIAVRAMDMRS